MKKPIIQKYAPLLWIISGVLCLLPSLISSSNNQPATGVGIMFIIFGIFFYQKKKIDTSASK